MDEGVDPKNMCQSLVEKIGQSEQLKSVADPELLILFEDWLEELENEALNLLKSNPPVSAKWLSEKLGLSESGSLFLMKKLQGEGKI